MTTDYLGWTVQDWLNFHRFSCSDFSYNKLLELVENQRNDKQSTAWISLIDSCELERQWRTLQSKGGKDTLPLYGVPVAIKDNIDVLGLPTTAACPAFAYSPTCDSKVVSLLRAAGAIIIGKTNMDQFATGLVGTRSPYGKVTSVFSKRHVSGGSSSGSASVVARGITPIALGTDTAGSGRVPAALNNIVGLKPTRGVISCSGVVPACKSLDCVSIFALNLADAERCFKALVEFDPDGDVYAREYSKRPCATFGLSPKVGIPKELIWYDDLENGKGYHKAVAYLRETGCHVVEIDFSIFLELARCLYEGPWVAERYAVLKEFYGSNPPLSALDPTVTEIIKSGEQYTASDAFLYEYKRQGMLKKIDEIMAPLDALCVPTCVLSPKLEDVEAEPKLVNARQGTWTNFVNLADLAALAVPNGFRSDGLPQGITFVGKKFTDYALLDLAKRFFDAAFPKCSRSYGIFFDKQVGNGDEVTGPDFDESTSVELAVVGAHLRGLPLHWQLEQANARFLGSPKTSANYMLYALPKTGPILKPALRRVPDGVTGCNIQLELYQIPVEKFGQLVSVVPAPLGIGSVELECGKYVHSFICEEYGYKQGGIDITSYGGFKAYIDHINAKETEDRAPFESVLVANRGEIAVRIIKTLKKLKIKAIAVYSETDKYSQHVRDADLAVPLGGDTAAESYLNIGKVLKAAKDTGAQAIIPGYGFLSENPSFVEACEREGIIFVGPNASTIYALGLKHSAKAIAQRAGVPLVPGSGLVTSATEAREIAEKLGYPVMVKSSAGGGGIGLQKVESSDDIELAFETVQHQGRMYFGDSKVFIERFIEHARHVEVQIMGDGYGKAIALGERDCSLQRRNQKIIEETPPPNVSERTKRRMREAATNMCSLLKYKCAGTVEFIYDEKRDEFYFLEVNTRLQVEHPITEMVTGLDLVEWMVLIAADKAPDFDSTEFTCNGSSIEARIYAENPLNSFRPSPGLLTEVKFPKWARVDTWVKKGTLVSANYDPTIAKIIVHGKDRTDAIAKMLNALDETVIHGCITNIDYVRSIVKSEMFQDASVFTSALDSYVYEPRAIEIVQPGAYTSIQDYPGRTGYWRVGVPPSGPMDSYSFRLANRIVGNNSRAPALEITLAGPTIRFHIETVIAVTGGNTTSMVNDKVIPSNTPVAIKRGDVLNIGKLVTGCRCYLAVRGGIDVPEFLGSRSTFVLGNFGGHNGRVLKKGDVLYMPDIEKPSCDAFSPVYVPISSPVGLVPNIPRKEWRIGVLCGPHGSPDFFTEEAAQEFYDSTWTVHYNSNRFGVRLVGPKPSWARFDGGEAGLHPSNAHDYVYSLGAINFTGDEPVIITGDGPSLGGFVCLAVVAEAEMWKVGQLKPGDIITFVPLSYSSARALMESQNKAIEALDEDALLDLDEIEKLEKFTTPILAEFAGASHMAPRVCYRQAGDRYILIEYGDNRMDFNISYRINRLIDQIQKNKTFGVLELSPGVRSLLVEFSGCMISQSELLKTLIAYETELLFTCDWSIKSKLFILPMVFEDSKVLAAVNRYKETIRSSAPWLPNNVDFIANVNGITRKDVEDMLFTARFMVLGLGDVFLGAPCAVPLDPRQRYLGTKYNPSRTFTPNGAVGIGGMYMCIYCTDSPGGYQLVGRTIPIWNKLQLGNVWKEKPWLLAPFDQIQFYPVTEEELDSITQDVENGTYKVRVEETVFDHKRYMEWVDENISSINEHQRSQLGEKAQSFAELIKVANSTLAESSVKHEVKPEYGSGAKFVCSEYSGRFWKTIVHLGDQVKKGDDLIIIEAMKTEMVVSSEFDGKVIDIIHNNGDMVDAGDLVVVLE